MDKIESLGNTLSQVTLYDIKSMYNQAKNMVLNVSEMEAKVREATNDDPWGASSTLMQEIAAGTHNFQQFNEIMPCIYSRFMDKEARQWREIYKALQLLEYIIKHGSERVVDDARSHISTIKLLRNFHYIDEKGKDQGINVRNRAKELTELLMDVDRIRTERRRAKANRNKYIGTGNDPMSYTSGSRYGGFGSDSLGSGSRTYGSGGGSGGGSYDRDYGGYSGGGSGSSGFRDDRRGFDEYNAGDDEIPASTRRANSLATSSGTAGGSTSQSAATAPPMKAPEKVVDLLGFDDDDYGAPAGSGKAAEKALPALASNPLDDGDDEFAEFQAAPVSAPVSPAPNAGTNASANMTIFAALASAPAQQTSFVAPVQQQRLPASTLMSASPIVNRTGYTSPPPPPGFGSMSGGVMSPISPSSATSARPAAPQATASFSSVKSSGGVTGGVPARLSSTSVGFDDLWNMSLGGGATSGAGAKSSASGSGIGSKSIKDLEKEKVQASIWGQGQRGAASASSMGLGSSGMNTFGGSTSASGGGDDLLL